MKTRSTLFILALALTACNSKESEYDASGVFEATEVMVSAKAHGEIISMRADEGDAISMGDTLGVIDMRQLSLKKDQLAASRSANDSRVLDTQKQIAALTQQISNAERELGRFTELLKAKAATQKQVDDIAYQISTLKAQRSALADQLTAQNQSLQEQSKAMTSQIGQVEEQMNDAVVTSPLTGVVLQKYCEQGEYAAPGKPLFKVADIKDMKLRAYITADQLTQVKLGQQVTVFADEGKEDRKAHKGTITWIAQQAEFTPKTIMTRDERANLVYAIKVSVDNKEGLIKSGMYGDIKLQ